MSVSTEPKAALSTADVRYLLNRWSSQGFFRVRRLGDRLSMLEVTSRSSYTLRLQTQYEERTVAPVTQPYHGGPVDDRGTPPGPWDLPARRPDGFQERTEHQPVPHTETVRSCARCNGKTVVVCAACHGNGRVKCNFCQGSGFRTRKEARTDKDNFGNPVTKFVDVEEKCTCHGGLVNCTSCNGQGTQTCPECAGAGRVKSFEQLTVHFFCPVLEDVVQGTKLPDNLLTRVTGAVLVNQRGELIERSPPVTPEVERRVEELLDKARANDARTRRILRQDLHVEQVNIQEVHYNYRGQDKCLWIYGNEQQVHAPGMPRPWWKLAALLGAPVVLVLLVVLLMHLFK
jgi:hypothetical protein